MCIKLLRSSALQELRVRHSYAPSHIWWIRLSMTSKLKINKSKVEVTEISCFALSNGDCDCSHKSPNHHSEALHCCTMVSCVVTIIMFNTPQTVHYRHAALRYGTHHSLGLCNGAESRLETGPLVGRARLLRCGVKRHASKP